MGIETPTDHCPISAAEWVIDDETLLDPVRKARLVEAPPPNELVLSVSDAVASAARSAQIRPMLVQAAEQPGHFRVEAKIPIPGELFDCLFNGRSGYRAHYYASPARGAAFNREIVDALTPAVLDAWRSQVSHNELEPISRSLSGQYSKIWVVGDGGAFLDAPAALKPVRWATYWLGIDSALGLRMPCPLPPQVDLKGTFVKLESDEEWVAEEKKDRDEDLFNKGWV